MTDPGRIMQELLGGISYSAYEEALFRRMSPEEVIRILEPVLTTERKDRIERVLNGRTRAIATVVEGVLNTGNVSAVMRTAEALGFQNFHVVTNDQPFKHSRRTSSGAEKWLDVSVWDHPQACVDHLHENGYRVLVTHLDARATPIESCDFATKTALVFGNELNGVSQGMLSLADEACFLPIEGFVQSYNISVAAAMALFQAHRLRTGRLGSSGDLTEADKLTLRASFYIRASEHAGDVIARALGDSGA